MGSHTRKRRILGGGTARTYKAKTDTGSPYCCTIVSAYYDIPSKRDHTAYIPWLTNLMKIENPIVLYTTEDLVDFFKELRGGLPLILKVCPFERIYMWENYKEEWIKDYEMDPEKHYHSPQLYAVWASKPVWLEEVAIENPFHTENFMWVDSGGFRIEKDQELYRKNFPKLRRFAKDKLIFSIINKFTEGDLKKVKTIIGNFTSVEGDFKDRIVGGFYGGNRYACSRWRKAYETMLLRYFLKGLFAGKDQPVMASVLLEDPSLGEILEPTLPDVSWGAIEHWLFIPKYLSDPTLKRKVYTIY